MTAKHATERLCALILAGGDGTRLSELTTIIAGQPIPKQYCRILGKRSMLEGTIDRVSPVVPGERTFVVINQSHLGLALDQVADLPAENLIVQPSNRDTGPGIVFSLLRIARRDPTVIVAVLPSDHYFGNPRAFQRQLKEAAVAVCGYPDKIVLLGVRPDRPETGYGYIEPSSAAWTSGRTRLFGVAAFHEKPDVVRAQAMIARGALWNSFVMVARVERLLGLVRTVRPFDYAQLVTAENDLRASSYDSLPSWSFSAAFLTLIREHLVVLPLKGTQWSDWGTRESIERTLERLGRIPPWQTNYRSVA
jgi:mannose-1-phosphate guanylyltransferase